MIRVPEGNAYFQSGMLCSCLRKGGTCGSRTTWHNHTQSFIGRQPSFHRCHLVNLMTRCYAEVCLVVYWLTPSSSASTPQCHMIWLWEHCNFYKYTALIYTRKGGNLWKTQHQTVVALISVSSFTMILIKSERFGNITDRKNFI